MKKITLIVLIILGKFSFSQSITAPTASYSLSTNYTNGATNDRIFGFCTPNNTGGAVAGALTASAGVANCTFVWTVFNPATNSYTAFTTQTGLTASTITGLASGGYHVTIKNSAGTVLACDLAWVWVNQTNATVSPIAAGCSPFSLNGTASAVSNFTYYNPPPEPFLISATTAITVCFNATHTYVSDLGFFLIGPAACGSPIVTLSPNPGANGQGSICNSGNNVNNLCFTTNASPNFNPCTAATPYTGTYDSYGAGTGTNINWSSLYGCDANSGGWKVQIFDCIGADVGSLTGASVSFSGNSGCGPSVVNYNSGAINSAINDNSCNSASASIYTVPTSPATSPITINNTITYQWTSVPASTIPNSNSSLTPNINPNPTVDTWYYLTVTDNFGCAKKDSAFFDYSPPGTPTITPAGPFCANAPASNLSATPTGGSWTGPGITNAANGTFNPATAGTGTFTITYTTPGACGASRTTTIIVNPVPGVTVPANQTVCNGTPVPAVTFTTNPVGSTISWTNTNPAIGLGASGTGNIPSFTGINNGSAILNAIVSVTPSLNGCSGTPANYTITINPTPVLSAVASQTVCNTAPTSAVNFNATPATATINWTNSNAGIGIGTNGSGNIPSFTGTNATSAQISGNFSAVPTLAGCTGTAIAFVISVNPTPVLNAITSQTLCSGAPVSAVNFTTTPAGASVSWTNSNPGIGIGTSGINNIPSFSATNSTSSQISGNFSAVPTLNTCVGPLQTFTVTVNPTPVLMPVTSQTICAGLPTAAVNFSTNPAGATINWNNTATGTGLTASGTGNIPSFTGQTPGTPLASIITATPTLNSCVGVPVTFTIQVNPTPSLASVASQTVCEGLPITAINFSPTPAGATVINWSNSATSIGLPATGSGNIASYNAANGTGAIVNAAFTATPSIGSCTGTPINFTITVKPAVTLNPVVSQTICEGLPTAAVNFSTNPAGATINWNNTATGTGLAASGTGNIPSFTGQTPGTPLASIITATPTLNSCVGVPVTFTIQVNPTPSLASVASQTVCEGLPITAINFSPTPAGAAVINWSNSATSIGLPATGSGNIASYNAANGTGAIVNAAFTATPSIGSCTGNPVNFTIIVNPGVTINTISNITVCNTDIVPASSFASNPTGATFAWTNSDNTIGLSSNGNGNYPSFTASNITTNQTIATISVTATLNGCVSPLANYSITVNPTPSSPSVTNAGYCLNQTASALSATASPNGTLNWWGTSVAGGTSTSSAPTPVTTTTGITNYYVSQTVSGCESPRAQIQVTVSSLPSVIAPADIIVCAGDVVPLQTFTTTPPGAAISWINTNTSIGLPGSGSGAINPFTASNSGLTTITSDIILTPNVGTCVGASVTFSISVKPLPLVMVNNVTACNNATVAQITWNSNPAGGTFNWSNSNTSIGLGSNGTTTIPSFNAVNNGSIPAEAIITVSPILNSCTGISSSFTITVNPTPPAPGTTAPIYCVNGNAVPLAANGSNLLWYTSLTGGTGSTAAPVPSTANTGTVSSYVSQTLLGCESPRAQIITTINALPIANLIPVAPSCPPLCTDLVISSSSMLTSYIWNLGDGSSFSGNDTVSAHCYNTSGLYTLSVIITDNNSCTNTMTFSNAIRVYDEPKAQFDFGPQPATLVNPTITFTSTSIGSPPLQNNWYFGDGFGSAINENTPEYTYQLAGNYNVQLITTTTFGCKDTVEMTVIIENDFAIYIPNSFSPNGDGLNDTFGPVGLGIDTEDFEMYIFDRWGTMIFFTDDITKGWDGKVNGKDDIVPLDIYVWKLDCKSLSGKNINKAGHVTIVR